VGAWTERDDVQPLLRGLDGLNHLVAGARLAPKLREARSVWVVAAAAPHGYAALRSGRPYAAWIATSLAEEWTSRRGGLPRSRRVSLRANAPLLLRLERQVVRGATRVYGISPASAEGLARAAGVEVGVLPIPVDLERFTPLPDDEWRARLAEPTLVFVGRGDDPRKNAALLLEAFPRLRERVPGARLRFVGSPPRVPLPDGVEALGEVPEVAPHLRDAALFVLPSLQEGFGIVAAEALACGVPVLATPSGGPEELVRASGGGRVLAGFTASELADAAADLLRDAATLAAMRERGREYVAREHSPQRLRELLADIL
jgi:phosphatidylinositol alpha-mannosyltransferase